MNPAQITLVQQSFAKVAPIADAAAAMFYQRLFELDPALTKLFRGDMKDQGKKLMAMIAGAVRGLDRLDTLVPVLHKLGARHVGYGVKEKDYKTVGAALLWTLEKGLGSGFTHEVRAAWTVVYGLLAQTMLDAAKNQQHSTKGNAMSIRNFNIGTRLTASFAALIVFLAAITGVGIMKLHAVDDHVGTMVGKDWVKADLSNELNSAMRGNARRSLELSITSDREQVVKIKERIEANKKTAAAALEKLEPLIYTPEGKALFARIQSGRTQYAGHLARFIDRIDAGDRGAATKIMIEDALPALDNTLIAIGEMVKLQGALVVKGGNLVNTEFVSARTTMLALGAGAVLLAILFGVFVTRSITVPMVKTIDIANAVAQGDLDTAIDAKASDETGRLLAALQEMQKMLRERRVSDLALQAETGRIKSALDVAATNVMIADAGLNIAYVNDSIREMLARAESDIRKDLPNFSAKTVVGTNIDSFHKNPAHQRGMLTNLRSTHKTDLKIGGRTFNLIVNPISDAAGARLGTVVEWKDATEELAARERELAAAAENLRIKNALDKCSTNVMIANADCEIVYMNDSVGEMMVSNESDLRKTLPQFDARRLIGANIDVFHKNPSHQRNMLANLRSTYRTEIKVGRLTFSLIASPINSADGKRVGTVVEWKDRTLEVAVEGEIGNIVGGAVKGDFSNRIALEISAITR